MTSFSNQAKSSSTFVDQGLGLLSIQPVSFWRLDESSGNASDAFGGNTLTNNNSVTYVSGKIGNGADFEYDVTNQSLSISDASQNGLGITGDISFSCWWKPESLSAEHFFATKLNGASFYSYIFEYDGTNLTLFISPDGSSLDSLYIPYTFSTGTWYHVACTWDASEKTATFYVNGASVGQSSGFYDSIFDSTSDFMIGNYQNSGIGPTDGILDMVGVWNGLLTDTDIAYLYNYGVGTQLDVSSSFNDLENSTQTTFLIDSTYQYLIDDSYKLIIGLDTGYSNQTKN